MYKPRQNKCDGSHQQHRQPVTEVVGAQVLQDEIDMYQIEFQTHRTHEGQCFCQPLRHMFQCLTQQQQCRDAQRYIDHTFHEKRETTTQAVLEIDTNGKGQHKRQQQ